MAGLRECKVIPHVAGYAANDHWPNWLREEERQHPGFAISQRKRKLVEKIFGWAKMDSILRKVKLRGQRRVDRFFRLLVCAANLRSLVSGTTILCTVITRSPPLSASHKSALAQFRYAQLRERRLFFTL